ncbi:MAG TPA: hypothetical protein VHB99_05610 [Pirellulales bacterium]|nr:hypothetical protein [Pirellulales bacterium]
MQTHPQTLLGWKSVFWLAISGLALTTDALAAPLTVEVQETAGIARFGYPVTGTFRWTQEKPAAFRLLRDGRPIEAQFSQMGAEDDGSQWDVDFNLDLAPFEKRAFQIEPLAKPPSELRTSSGLTLERDAGTIRLRRPGLDFETPEDLFHLLRAVKSPKQDYFVPGSAKFFVRDSQGKKHQIEATSAADAPRIEILKAGPLCAALQSTSRVAAGDGAPMTTTLRLDFPRSKSWVRVEWTVEEVRSKIEALGVEFQLRLAPVKGRPTLVDFGAPSGVYTALEPSQRTVFRASPPASDGKHPWEITRGSENRMLPYVVGLEGDARPVEGWVHVMDQELCTAIAVDRFARETNDRIEASADGRVQIWREYAKGAGAESPEAKTPATKTLVFWLHFVPSPPHVGAVTSPQSMQSPPEVRVTAPE